ncbi:hypothetical protein JZ785_15560 [Alicyclobacillus curvatus]|jgi:hypothetical protein|nr:hypothetical protein JZ785_15560 [Alicyclobacillus curvatus]
MVSLSFGIGPQTLPISQILQDYVQQGVSQELQKVGNFVTTEGEKLLHGQPGSILDLYA